MNFQLFLQIKLKHKKKSLELQKQNGILFPLGQD